MSIWEKVRIIAGMFRLLWAPLSLLLVVSSVSAQRAPSHGVVPWPKSARSAEVHLEGAVIRQAPAADAKRRGTVKMGTRLPVLERLYGPGCEPAWLRVGEQAFICESAVEKSPLPPWGENLSSAKGALLPREYGFIRVDGTRAYAHPHDAYSGEYVEAFGKGFGLVLGKEKVSGGVSFVRTRKGLWVERSEINRANPSTFRGYAIEPGVRLSQIGFVVKATPVYASPGGRKAGALDRLVRVCITKEERGWLLLCDGSWVRTRNVARPQLVAPPEELSPARLKAKERWVDVDTKRQVLVAYEGDAPVYVTLVSTGKDKPSHRTPPGTFHIWVKLVDSDMDDLERDDISVNYAIEAVPWVQYFKGSNGFHAAFWHSDFGQKKSHGCVNLAPLDAQWLFRFTGPDLPPGWYAILPTSDDRGTLVRIR